MERAASRLLVRRLRLLTLMTVALGLTLTLGLILRPPAQQANAPGPQPLAGWVILVDPGHGGYDGGARARDSGTWEKEINLAVALEVEKALKAQGAEVVLTRRADVDLCDDAPQGKTKKRQDMERRVAMGREHQADLVLSIHMNEYRDRTQSGPQVFYRKECEQGRLLAGCMQQALIQGLSPARERAALPGDYFILQLPVPSVLIECGFLSNAAEEKQLLTKTYQERLGQAVAQGVITYRTLEARRSGAPFENPPAEEP